MSEQDERIVCATCGSEVNRFAAWRTRGQYYCSVAHAEPDSVDAGVYPEALNAAMNEILALRQQLEAADARVQALEAKAELYGRNALDAAKRSDELRARVQELERDNVETRAQLVAIQLILAGDEHRVSEFMLSFPLPRFALDIKRQADAALTEPRREPAKACVSCGVPALHPDDECCRECYGTQWRTAELRREEEREPQ